MCFGDMALEQGRAHIRLSFSNAGLEDALSGVDDMHVVELAAHRLDLYGETVMPVKVLGGHGFMNLAILNISVEVSFSLNILI